MERIARRTSPLSVAVIGGGIIGLFTSLELLGRGFSVDLIEPEAVGGRHAASYGNGTWVNEGAIIPISLPGMWKAVPGFLADPLGPFALQWRYVPSILPWLVRFLLAGRSWSRVEKDIPARAALLRGAVAGYEARAVEAGIQDLIAGRGVMYIYRSREEFSLDNVVWGLRAKYGINYDVVEGDDLALLAPDLSPEYVLGARILPAVSLRDPGGFCQGLAQLIRDRGGHITKAAATGFDIDDGKLNSVLTDQGPVACDYAVIAAGIGSATLARTVGDAVPLIAERGYHVEVRDSPIRPTTSLMPADGKMAVASTIGGLRLAGQVELATPNTPPDWCRARILLAHAHRMFPQIAEMIDNGPHDLWMGNRPSMPDSLPVIGRSYNCSKIIHAFGHGHTGMAMAPRTASLVADLVAGVTPMFDPKPYSPRRFRIC